MLYSLWPFFLFGWGIVGAALGTVLACLVVLVLRQKVRLPLCPFVGIDCKFLELSTPAAVESADDGLEMVTTSWLLFGTEAVAGNAIGDPDPVHACVGGLFTVIAMSAMSLQAKGIL